MRLLSLLLSLLVIQPAYAQSARGADTRTWYQAYQDGRRQVQQGNWQAAIASLQQAKRSGPRPGRRIPFYGDVFDDFLPDYYLGLAYLNTQQYKDATASFEAVRQSGLIAAKDREFGEFTRQAALATTEFEKTTLVKATPPPNNPSQTAPPGERPDPEPPVQQTPPVTQTAANVPAPNAVAPATTPAPRPAPLTPAAQVAIPNVPTGTTGVRQSGANVQNRVKLPPTTAPNTSSPAVVALGSESSAMAAFFAGDYQRAFTMLSALAVRGATPRTEFYLACSSAALALTGGMSPDQSSRTLDNARSRFAQLDAAQFATDERYVSPKVLQTLRAAR